MFLMVSNAIGTVWSGVCTGSAALDYLHLERKTDFRTPIIHETRYEERKTEMNMDCAKRKNMKKHMDFWWIDCLVLNLHIFIGW